MKTRAVLFDLDGVLVDTREAWFRLLVAATRELGYPEYTRDQFQQQWGQGIQADVDLIFKRHTVGQMEEYFNRRFIEHAGGVAPIPGARDAFAAVKASGLRTAVITNTPSPLARVVLSAGAYAPEALVGGTDVARCKPAPDMVYRACEVLVVDTSEAVVVGDSRFDQEAAKSAGVRFIGYRMPGDASLDDLRDLPREIIALESRRTDK